MFTSSLLMTLLVSLFPGNKAVIPVSENSNMYKSRYPVTGNRTYSAFCYERSSLRPTHGWTAVVSSPFKLHNVLAQAVIQDIVKIDDYSFEFRPANSHLNAVNVLASCPWVDVYGEFLGIEPDVAISYSQICMHDIIGVVCQDVSYIDRTPHVATTPQSVTESNNDWMKLSLQEAGCYVGSQSSPVPGLVYYLPRCAVLCQGKDQCWGFNYYATQHRCELVTEEVDDSHPDLVPESGCQFWKVESEE